MVANAGAAEVDKQFLSELEQKQDPELQAKWEAYVISEHAIAARTLYRAGIRGPPKIVREE